ncbi:Dodecaprenyl-phosphate galacturonate synthase [Clarias magur]|uniref:Dodecaprenyl-phosphate galacturonate synthase n=1 Tax=Clarias magur TaxID=1594786 RepID=A0A8J4UIE8_CLAMG|nr:Dodecaprenyl-phosphate galacturonate synthase [Clarias magur]
MPTYQVNPRDRPSLVSEILQRLFSILVIWGLQRPMSASRASFGLPALGHRFKGNPPNMREKFATFMHTNQRTEAGEHPG